MIFALADQGNQYLAFVQISHLFGSLFIFMPNFVFIYNKGVISKNFKYANMDNLEF